LILYGEDQGTRFELSRAQYHIGRGIGCEIRLDDSEVSRFHATLKKDGERYRIHDENSSNGTLVNGQLVTDQLLEDGDTLLLGRTTLLYSQKSPSDLKVTDRIKLFSEPEQQERSSIISHATLNESQSVFAPARMRDAAESTVTFANLQALYRITEETVSSTHSIEQILQKVLEEALVATGAERGCILLQPPGSHELKASAVIMSEDDSHSRQIPVSRTIVDYVRQEQRGVRTADARSDQRFSPGQSILREGIREAICVPMQGKYELVGVIYVDSTSRGYIVEGEADHHFNESHLHLLMAVGRQTALAIENHRYQEALIKAERLAAMGETVAAISHHIKNILQGIRGGVYLIESGLKDEKLDVIRTGWQIVDRNQNRIFNLVQDMLSISKEREPDYSVSQLGETVQDALGLVQRRAEEAGVEISVDIEEDIPESRYDEESIHRAILNLLTNALDAIEEVDAGKILVACGYNADSDRLFVSVADNGPGIPDEQRHKIFEAFHSTKGGRGTGLGLAVSRKILREHDGELLLETKVGQGSRFTMAWPTASQEDLPRAPGSSIIRQDAPK